MAGGGGEQIGKRSYGVKLVRGPLLRLDPHPLACYDGEELLDLVPSFTKPLAADLFCGAGGLSLGLTEAGFEVVLAVDHDEEALETHRANHPGLSVNWDLGDDSVVEDVADLVTRCGIRLVAGGPPCQPFSRAGRSMIRELVRTGRRHHHDHRRDLWDSFLGVVEIARPEAVLMENVPDMALDRGMVILRAMIERLEAAGYAVEERVVDTSLYGVPQFRQRLVLVALRDGVAFEWPAHVDTPVSLKQAIDDLPPVVGGWRPTNGPASDPVARGWAEYGGPNSAFQTHARRAVPSADAHKVFDHITRPVRDDDAAAFAQMDSTTRYSDLDASLKRYRDDIFDDKYKRLDPFKKSRTITAHIAKDGYSYIHPYEDRTLTVREAARIQTFPDHVRFAGTPSSAFRQIGNAVPPLLGERVGAAILDALRRRRRQTLTTRLVAEELAAWYQEGAPTALPWLAAETRWGVIQAELLWSRISDDLVGTAWAAVRNYTTPQETLGVLDGLRRLADKLGRGNRIAPLEQTARWFTAEDDRLGLLGSAGLASQLTAAPNVTVAMADLAVRVVPGEAEDPVLAGYGVLRVAARFQGISVDRQNKLSDGRLAVARMISHQEHSHEAHLALIELAGGHCAPQGPSCGKCPLEPWCQEALKRPVQPVLDLSSPARRPPLDRSPSASR